MILSPEFLESLSVLKQGSGSTFSTSLKGSNNDKVQSQNDPDSQPKFDTSKTIDQSTTNLKPVNNTLNESMKNPPL